MPDPVYAADVLAGAFGRPPHGLDELQVDALLAYGGGDPVVTMPDGTLRRLVDAGLKESVDPPHVPLGPGEVACCEDCWRPADLYRLTDPVQP